MQEQGSGSASLSGRLSVGFLSAVAGFCQLIYPVGIYPLLEPLTPAPRNLSFVSSEMGKVVPASYLLPGPSLIVETFLSTLKGSDERH